MSKNSNDDTNKKYDENDIEHYVQEREESIRKGARRSSKKFHL